VDKETKEFNLSLVNHLGTLIERKKVTTFSICGK